MMCISAALAGAATLAVTRRNPAKRATPSAEEKFVPEQVLQFRDARRLPLAEFEIGTNHVNILRLYGAHGYAATVLLYDDSGGWSLLLDGKEVNDETVEKPKTKDLLKSLEELATRQTEDNYARPTRGTLSVRTLGDRSNIMIDVRMPSGKSEIFYTKAFLERECPKSGNSMF